MRFWRWLLPLMLAAAAWPAQAQSPAALALLEIELWPEFDRPAALVLLTGTLASTVPLPAEVTVRLPGAAGPPHAVAYQASGGQLMQAEYTTRAEGQDLLVVLTSPTATFHVEYYDPALDTSAATRQMAFQWTADHPVQATILRVQQPYAVEAMTFSPALNVLGAREYGLTYYGGELGALAAGQTLRLAVSYTKTDPTLSAEAVVPPESASAEPVAVPTGAANEGLNTWVIGGAVAGGVAVLLGAGWLVWQRREKTGGARKSRHGRRSQGAAAAPQAPTARFCTQCGQPARAEDRFCRSCGAAIRSAGTD